MNVCVAPPRVDVDPEPEYTPGTTNTISWSDEAWGGALEYKAFMSTDLDFNTIVDESDWVPGLSHEFTDLVDSQRYYFKVNAQNFEEMVSLCSQDWGRP